MINFEHIDYLKTGNQRQRLAYQELEELGMMEALKEFQPILVGTIPIEIDLPTSDLDIICTCVDHVAFAQKIKQLYQVRQNFTIKTKMINEIQSTVANFFGTHFEVEIFGQKRPTQKQDAYRHLLVEHRLLEANGDAFRKEIIRLKSEGMKTEPAFAKVLQLSGNPYQALLELDLSQ